MASEAAIVVDPALTSRCDFHPSSFFLTAFFSLPRRCSRSTLRRGSSSIGTGQSLPPASTSSSSSPTPSSALNPAIPRRLRLPRPDPSKALLSGCSAGGLATLLNCDDFREVLPKGTNVKRLADAAFFLDEKDISGNRIMRSFFHNVVQLQTIAKSVGDWYFERRRLVKEIDGEYPCNPSCVNLNFT